MANNKPKSKLEKAQHAHKVLKDSIADFVVVCDNLTADLKNNKIKISISTQDDETNNNPTY